MSATPIDTTATVRAAGQPRGQWSSRTGFVLAAAGSAVGLGSIWKFPYITGVNGGGWFVLIYLGCIVLIALPIMIAETLMGRATQRSPVDAFARLAGRRTPWQGIGWIGVAAAFLILSYYSVVAGWTLHYTWLSISGALEGVTAEQAKELFRGVASSTNVNVFWHAVFMSLVVCVALAGVRDGVERCNRVLMPLLLGVMLMLVVRGATSGGFARAMDFVFGLRAGELSADSVLEALGHSFFTLSLGMGAMITYGSYMSRSDSVVGASAWVAGLDTLVSLAACLAVFPFIFAFGLAPDGGPGLVFLGLPVAFARMPAPQLWGGLFFGLLGVAALASAVSLLEVLTSHCHDRHGWSRTRASLTVGAVVFLFGLPAALSGSTAMFGAQVQSLTAAAFGGPGRNWFDTVDHFASNWLLPAGGLGIAAFLAWRVGAVALERAFDQDLRRTPRICWMWVALLRYVVPPGVLVIFLNAIGML